MPRNKQTKEPRTEKFRITIVDDTTHRHLRTMRFTRWTFFLTVISILTILLIGTYSLIAFTSLRTFIPGYPDARSRGEAARNTEVIDSLENVISRWEFYSENLTRVLEGEAPVPLDSLIKIYDTQKEDVLPKEYLMARDSLLRQTVREEGRFGLSSSQARDLPIEGLHFFTPMKGVVSRSFEAVIHPYIDITAPIGSVVMAVLDGTVVNASWSDEYEYTLVIQHSDDIISVYRHNQKLLRKEGDKVSAGSSVALVGNAGSSSTESHLHFELWYKGEAIDPVKYITF